MAIIPEELGSTLPPLGAAMSGLGRAWGARAHLEAIAEMGLAWVTLDATHPELRARRLGRTARRDIAALLRRLELMPSGIDLRIPSNDFLDAAKADVATAAAVATIEFAADLSALADRGVVVAVHLPGEAHEARGAIAEAADIAGVTIADFGPAPRSGSDTQSIMAGVDPGAVILERGDDADVGMEVAALRGRVADARLSDATGGARASLGTGSLDVLGYLGGLSAAAYGGVLTVDVRGLAHPAAAMRQAVEFLRGERSSPTMS